MDFVYSTGGRENYFKQTNVRDCVTRAIANATGMDYLEVYNGINAEAKKEHKGKRMRGRSTARNGVYKGTIKRYIEGVLGWVWVPCMGIGTGCQTHLCEDELPKKGNYILNLSGHLSCIKDGVLYDTYDCSRNGTRCVYGYWRAPTQEEKDVHEETKAQLMEYKQFVENEKAQLKLERERVKKHNQAVMKKYAKKINKLASQLRKLERERDKQLLELPKLKKDSWALNSAKLIR